MIRLLAVFALLLVAAPALAQFEGRAEYKVRAAHGDGRVTMLVSKAGARTDVTIDVPGAPARVTTLVRASEPGRIYFVNDERRKYTVMDLPRNDARYRVERLGRETVAGHACEKAAVTGDGAGRVEVCVTSDFGAIPAVAGFRGDRGNGNFFAALQRAGLSGLPVRWQEFDASGKAASTAELVSARKEKVSPDQLSVPAGYEKGSAYDTLATPEQQQRVQGQLDRMREQLQQLPPEQRARAEQMMRDGTAAGKR
jgi:hypothetical protein